MGIYLVQADADSQRLDAVEQALKPAVPDLARVERIEDIGRRSLKTAGRDFVIVPAPSTDRECFVKLAEVASRYRGKLFFIIVSGEISASDYKLLIQSENADWSPETGLPDEVLRILDRVGARIGDPAAPAQPILVSFIPSSGGAGNSTLIVETAVQLAAHKALRGRKLAVVDLDFHSSHVCDYLDLTPRFQVEELSDAPERLDDQLLDAFASRHSSGVDVFAAPRAAFKTRQLSVDTLSVLFDRLAHRYAFILADLPVEPYSWTIPLLSASEGILVTGLNTIPSLRKIATALRAIQSESGVGATPRVVLNRCEFKLFGSVAHADHAARVLPGERPFFVRKTGAALESINLGAPMSIANPTEKAVKDIGAIVDYCLALKPGTQRT